MATYIHGSSEIQADPPAGLQTLYLMNNANNSNGNYLNATGYSETHYHALHHTQSQPHHQYQYIHDNNNSGLLLGVNPVVVGATISEDLNRSFSSSSSSRVHYNSTIWGPAATDNKSSTIPAGTGTHQGLSLSLSYREQAGLSTTSSMARPAAVISNGNGRGDTSADNNNIVMGSKYLKAAQQLLDEVVKVVEGGGGEKIESNTVAGRGEEGSGGGESTGKQRGHELTTAQRQELQMKKAKLINMLEEV